MEQYRLSIITEVMATKGRVSPVTERVLDLRCLSTEAAGRLSHVTLLAVFLWNFANVVTEHGNGAKVAAEARFAWGSLSWRREPTPRVQVRTHEPQFCERVKTMLSGQGYEVRVKDDHLVVIL